MCCRLSRALVSFILLAAETQPRGALISKQASATCLCVGVDSQESSQSSDSAQRLWVISCILSSDYKPSVLGGLVPTVRIHTQHKVVGKFQFI
ncbi:hypothetical protein F5B22DRAFT_470817 [Xylaria bambusicola]|uniref:uncharacterized protein n=1 Tax=Xylaria bambusicola TaxID=326684 RepID=UPI0020083485|nr:uncharacterized protein F5B22DRAFT_470817 [Xylaria bambusicola]KAI0506209.1 hypothetical protein F5B22DRAFT_470817 [Xylaria bambusicola]